MQPLSWPGGAGWALARKENYCPSLCSSPPTPGGPAQVTCAQELLSVWPRSVPQLWPCPCPWMPGVLSGRAGHFDPESRPVLPPKESPPSPPELQPEAGCPVSLCWAIWGPLRPHRNKPQGCQEVESRPAHPPRRTGPSLTPTSWAPRAAAGGGHQGLLGQAGGRDVATAGGRGADPAAGGRCVWGGLRGSQAGAPWGSAAQRPGTHPTRTRLHLLTEPAFKPSGTPYDVPVWQDQKLSDPSESRWPGCYWGPHRRWHRVGNAGWSKLSPQRQT